MTAHKFVKERWRCLNEKTRWRWPDDHRTGSSSDEVQNCSTVMDTASMGDISSSFDGSPADLVSCTASGSEGLSLEPPIESRLDLSRSRCQDEKVPCTLRNRTCLLIKRKKPQNKNPQYWNETWNEASDNKAQVYVHTATYFECGKVPIASHWYVERSRASGDKQLIAVCNRHAHKGLKGFPRRLNTTLGMSHSVDRAS